VLEKKNEIFTENKGHLVCCGECRCADGENATLAEFEQVLKAMKLESLVPLAPRVFDLFDNNRDGTVDMREILCGLSSLRNSRGDDALRLCFQVM
jgi:Ca2+-binding EF-hand superfamily protein